jgi:integrase
MTKVKNGGNPAKSLEYVKVEISNHNSDIKARYGSRGICTVKVVDRSIANATLTLTFTYPVNRDGIQDSVQYSVGMGSAHIPLQVTKAKNASNLITHVLKNNRFSDNPIAFWDYLDYDVLGKAKKGITPKIIGELIDAYKVAFIADNKDAKNPESKWEHSRGRFFKNLPSDAVLTSKVLIDFVNSLDDNVAAIQSIGAIRALLQYHDLEREFGNALNCRKFIGKDTVERETYVPTDEEIIQVWENGFSLFYKDGRKKNGKLLHAAKAYQFVFGIMATYGIRAHEFWHVMNWHNPVDISVKEWVRIDSDDADDSTDDEYGLGRVQLESDRIIPAFFDPSNEFPMLVVGDDTKTGKRLAMPLSPAGDNWIERFHLKDGLILPDIKEPLKSEMNNGAINGSSRIIKQLGAGKTSTIAWESLNVTRFSSHKLRHAYTHRGRCLGVNPWKLAQSQGHTLSTAESVYAKNLASQRTAAMLKDEWQRVYQQNKLPQLTKEQAIKISESLKAETTDIDLLVSKLIEAIYR